MRSHDEELAHAQKYLRELRLPEGWMLMRSEVEADYPIARLPLVRSVRLELIGWKWHPGGSPMEVTVEVTPSQWDPEWLYATLLTMPESVPVLRLEVSRPY